MFLLDSKDSRTVSFGYIYSRQLIESDAPEGPNEIEADEIVKSRFLAVIDLEGKLEEEDLVYLARLIPIVGRVNHVGGCKCDCYCR